MRHTHTLDAAARPRLNGRVFTLIELLTVIAIIAILAAILFPVYNKLKAKGYQSVCFSNMRQIAIACTLYAGDNKDFAPGSAIDWWNEQCYKRSNWCREIAPYVKSDELFKCPATKKAALWQGWVNISGGAAGPPGEARWWTSFGYNCYLGNFDANGNIITDPNWRVVRRKLSTLRYPTQLIMLADCSYIPDNTPPELVQDDPDCNLWPEGRLKGGGHLSPRHSNGANLAFCDGHVKWRRYENIPKTIFSRQWVDPTWVPPSIKLSD